MSEEQYFIDDDGFVVDKTDLHILMDNDDCCEELNILYKENKKLKGSLYAENKNTKAILEVIDKKIVEYEEKDHDANCGDCICVKYHNQIECLKELKKELEK